MAEETPAKGKEILVDKVVRDAAINIFRTRLEVPNPELTAFRGTEAENGRIFFSDESKNADKDKPLYFVTVRPTGDSPDEYSPHEYQIIRMANARSPEYTVIDSGPDVTKEPATNFLDVITRSDLSSLGVEKGTPAKYNGVSINKDGSRSYNYSAGDAQISLNTEDGERFYAQVNRGAGIEDTGDSFLLNEVDPESSLEFSKLNDEKSNESCAIEEASPEEQAKIDRLQKLLDASKPSGLKDPSISFDGVSEIEAGEISYNYSFNEGDKSFPVSFRTKNGEDFSVHSDDSLVIAEKSKDIKFSGLNDKSYLNTSIPVPDNPLFPPERSKEPGDPQTKENVQKFLSNSSLGGKKFENITPARATNPGDGEAVSYNFKSGDTRLSVVNDNNSYSVWINDGKGAKPYGKTFSEEEINSGNGIDFSGGKKPAADKNAEHNPAPPKVKAEGAVSRKWAGYKGGNMPEIMDTVKWAAREVNERTSGRNINVDNLAAVCEHESGFNPNAGSINKKTGNVIAGGLFQFTDKTWDFISKDAKFKDNDGKQFTLKEKYPDLNWGNRFDITANALAGAYLYKRNADVIGSDSPTKIYTAHNIGLGGYKHFNNGLENSPDSRISSDRADIARNYKSNPVNFMENGKFRTYGDAFQTMSNHLDDRFTQAVKRGWEVETESGEKAIAKHSEKKEESKKEIASGSGRKSLKELHIGKVAGDGEWHITKDIKKYVGTPGKNRSLEVGDVVVTSPQGDQYKFGYLSGGHGKGAIPYRDEYDLKSRLGAKHDGTIDNFIFKQRYTDKKGNTCYRHVTEEGIRLADQFGKEGRTGILIHPDREANGTIGCVGINPQHWGAFRELWLNEVQKNGKQPKTLLSANDDKKQVEGYIAAKPEAKPERKEVATVSSRNGSSLHGNIREILGLSAKAEIEIRGGNVYVNGDKQAAATIKGGELQFKKGGKWQSEKINSRGGTADAGIDLDEVRGLLEGIEVRNTNPETERVNSNAPMVAQTGQQQEQTAERRNGGQMLS